MSRILTVSAVAMDKVRADYYSDRNVPVAYIRGKHFYIWCNDRIVKHRFLGHCMNQYAIRIATLKEDCWSES